MVSRKSGLAPGPRAVERLIEVVRAWNGESKDPGAQVLTRRDLEEAGLGRGFMLRPLRQVIERTTPGVEGGVAPPSIPTNFSVASGYGMLFLSWDLPRYPGHSHTELRRSTADALGDAPLVAQLTAPLYADFKIEPSVDYYYWIRHVNVLGQTGPWNATVGTSGSIAPSVAFLRNELSQQIRESELFPALASRIELIDAPASVGGSVSRRVQDARNELQAEIDTINSVLSDIEALPEFDADENYAVDDRVRYEGALYRNIQATTAPSPLPTDTAFWEKIGDYASLGDAVAAHSAQLSSLETRVTGAEDDLGAEIIRINTLESAVNDSSTGLATKASVSELNQAKADIYGAAVSQFSQINARFSSTDTAINARATITQMDNAVSGVFGAAVSSFTAIDAKFDAVDAAVDSKASITQLDDAVSDIYNAAVSSFAQIDARFTSVEDDIDTRATVTYVDSATADAEGNAVAAATQQVWTALGEANAAGVETRAEAWNGVAARWTVKTQVGDLVGGVGLLNDGQKVRFYAQADEFALYGSGVPDDPSAIVPFIFKDDALYLKAALIEDATITVAKLQEAFVDSLVAAQGKFVFAQIARGDIFDLTIGNEIKSDNYVAGSTGFRLSKNGVLEIGASGVRGLAAGQNLMGASQIGPTVWTSRWSTIRLISLEDAGLSPGDLVSLSAEVRSETGADRISITLQFQSTSGVNGNSVVSAQVQSASYQVVKAEGNVVPANAAFVRLYATNTDETETAYVRRFMLTKGAVALPFEQPPARVNRGEVEEGADVTGTKTSLNTNNVGGENALTVEEGVQRAIAALAANTGQLKPNIVSAIPILNLSGAGSLAGKSNVDWVSDVSGDRKPGDVQRDDTTIGSDGWYRIATNPGNRAKARFILFDRTGGRHNSVEFILSCSYNRPNNATFTLLDHARFSTSIFAEVRLLTATTHDTMYVDVRLNNISGSTRIWLEIHDNVQASGWSISPLGAASVPSGYTATHFQLGQANVVSEVAKNALAKTNDWTRPTTTLIDGNKIFTGDAYVDTLQIKGNAVTLPVDTFADADVWNNGSALDWIIYAQVTITSSGGEIRIESSALFRTTHVNDQNVNIRVLRNGTDLFLATGLQRIWGNNRYTPMTYAWADSPGAGTWTYRVEFRSALNVTMSAKSRSLRLQEFKR